MGTSYTQTTLVERYVKLWLAPFDLFELVPLDAMEKYRNHYEDVYGAQVINHRILVTIPTNKLTREFPIDPHTAGGYTRPISTEAAKALLHGDNNPLTEELLGGDDDDRN